MRRIRSGCCARAASGHAAAPPRAAINARRFVDRQASDFLPVAGDHSTPSSGHVAERHRPADGVFLLQGHACRLANRLTTGRSASAISAINLLSIALPNVLKVSATITNEFCPPTTFSR